MNEYKNSIFGEACNKSEENNKKISSGENLDLKTCDSVRCRLKNFSHFKSNKKSFSKSYESGEFKWKLLVDNDKNGYLACFIQLNIDWYNFFSIFFRINPI